MQFLPKPFTVFRYFTQLAAIPHGSGHTDGIRQWMMETAEKLGLPAYADPLGNVVIRKEGTDGYEHHDRVILQGHMDMVCAKLPSCGKDMETEGLDLVWEEDFLSAKDTTLGGDDGIALAFAFAILESEDIPHPPLTVIFTVDEETGMEGAAGLSPFMLDGKYLLNLDSEEEGVFTVGCAGGTRLHMSLPLPMEALPHGCSGYTITISGLLGGHSGTDIHKPRLNANVTMHALLSGLPCPIRLCNWTGGERDNVIPTACTVTIVCDENPQHALRETLDALCAEYPDEAGVQLDVQPAQPAMAATQEDTATLLERLDMLPNGVFSMDKVMNQPETSLNLAIMSMADGAFCVDALIRSNSDEKRIALACQLHNLVASWEGTSEESGIYPAWEYRPDSDLVFIAERVFESLSHKKPVLQTIHAGLECGILTSKARHLQCLSIGPDIFDIHTPRERLSISSTARTYEFLCELLKNL